MSNFYICKTGKTSSRWTILTISNRQFKMVEFNNIIVERESMDFLKTVLNSGTVADVAEFVGCHRKRIEKLRRTMGIAGPLGGDRRSKEFSEHYDPLPPRSKQRIVMLGTGENAVIVVANSAISWVQIPQRQIIYDISASERIKEWLADARSFDVAADFEIAISKVASVRKHFGVPSPYRKGENKK